jgi:hypothetical protein
MSRLKTFEAFEQSVDEGLKNLFKKKDNRTKEEIEFEKRDKQRQKDFEKGKSSDNFNKEVKKGKKDDTKVEDIIKKYLKEEEPEEEEPVYNKVRLLKNMKRR